ncbi:hypothetical protein ACP70R_037543 [Stipagrostis hirtigluma subsp. patula]
MFKYNSLRIEHNLCKDIAKTFDLQTGEFVIRGNRLKMTIEDVGHILGLPAKGPEIKEIPSRKLPTLFQKYKWHADTTIRGTTLKNYFSTTEDSYDDFTRLFVLYTIGFYLCPTTQPYVKSEYIALVKKVEEIKDLNWCSLTIRSLNYQIRKFMVEEKANLAGNLVLLQIWRAHQSPNRVADNLLSSEQTKGDDSAVNENMVNQEDFLTLQYIYSSSDSKILVDYGNYKVDKKELGCLLDPEAKCKQRGYNSKIKNREDGDVYLETAYISKMLWRDGTYQIGEGLDQNSSIVRRTLTYLKHDMREIQLLDSLSGQFGDDDLKKVGLEKHLKLAVDLGLFKEGGNVTCGLFMLKLCECWTGNRLSTIFTQKDMTNLRLKQAVLLVNAPLNRENGSPGYKPTDNPTANSEDEDL